MKLKSVNGKIWGFAIVAFLILWLFQTAYVVEAASPVLYIEPLVTHGNPGGAYITIELKIEEVVDLYQWNLRIKKPLGPLSPLYAEEGPFLGGGGARDTEFSYVLHADNLAIVNNLVGVVPGVSGDGTLATITFQVIDTGRCTIKPYDTELWGIDTGPPPEIHEIDHTVGSSKFYTTYPVAVEITDEPYSNYFYTPNPTQTGHPLVGEPLTFNASACYDPDQSYKGQTGSGIVSYEWDFGDGNVTTVAEPVITHSYAENRTHMGSLMVTDDDGETDTEIFSVDVRLHDINILDVTATPAAVLPGGIVDINVTILNEGSMRAYFNVSVAYDESLIEMMVFKQVWLNPQSGVPSIHPFLEPGENATMSWNPDPTSIEFMPLSWNTTGVAPGTYTITAHAFLVDQAHTDEALVDIEEDLDDNTFIDCEAKILGPNIAVTNVVAHPTNVVGGDIVYIDVTVTNEGGFTETSIEVTPYYDGTAAASKETVPSLAKGASDTLEFEWNTTDVPKGTYTISAEASVVPDETDIEDNTYIDGTVTIMRVHPVASFTYSPSEPFVGDTVTFNASASIDPDGYIVNYDWSFGDGTSDTDMVVTHAYPAEGVYTIALTVIDNDGLSNIATANITVRHRVLSIQLSGEHDYLLMEAVKIRVAALVTDPATMESVSAADVAIDIYDPEGNLWFSGNMTERLLGTGIYEWNSTKTIRELMARRLLSKGVYLVHAQASYRGGPIATGILEFHIDPPLDEPIQLHTILLFVTAGALVSIFPVWNLAHRRHAKKHHLQ